MLLATVFRHTEYEGQDPPSLKGFDSLDLQNPDFHIYSRYTQPTSTRVEAVLSSILVCTYKLFLSSQIRSSDAILSTAKPLPTDRVFRPLTLLSSIISLNVSRFVRVIMVFTRSSGSTSEPFPHSCVVSNTHHLRLVAFWCARHQYSQRISIYFFDPVGGN